MVEVAGALSTFGQQTLSTKPSEPRTRFGTGTRTEKTAEKTFEFKLLGATSTGITTNSPSAFGAQTASRCATAPSHRFGNRYASDLEMGKESRPGPGSYEPVEAVGKQPLSPNANMPTWRIGTGGRFAQFKTVMKTDFQTPAANNPRPASGWLGDAPKYSFHGVGRRADISKGLPGQKPTACDDPGPGMYEVPSALGSQHDSRKQTSQRTRIGTSSRDRIHKSQFISEEHAKGELCGKHSPGPGLYNPKDLTSRVSTPQSFRFGSGDRFSQVKPREVNRLPKYFATPGPGSYVV